MTELPTGASYAEQIRALGEAFAQAIEGLEDAAFHRRADPDAWSIGEITGHVAEAPLTFATQSSALARQPGMALGRNLDDPGRLAAVAALGSATPAEAAALVRERFARAAAIVATLDEDDLAAAGIRVANGETFTARQMIEVNIVDHIGGHLAAVRELAG